MNNTQELETIEKQVRKLRQIKPNPVWKAGLRTIAIKKVSPSRGSLPIFWRGKIFAVGSLVLLFFFGTGVVASSSLPGDSLYPFKRRFEEMQLSALGNRSNLEVQQELTQRRVADLTKVVQMQKDQVQEAISEVRASVKQVREQIADAKAQYQSLTQTGQDTTQVKRTLIELKPALNESQEQLSSIQIVLAGTEQKEVTSLIDSLKEIEKEVEEVTLEEIQPLPNTNSPTRTTP